MSNVVKRITEVMEKYADKLAFEDENGKKTYGDIDRESGKIYAYLKEKGIGRENFVQILVPRGTAGIVAMVGVMKAGAAFVVSDTNYPQKRLEFIRNDVGVKLVLDEETYQYIMKNVESLPGYEDADVHDAAFALYTSGSTGAPKGILHEYGTWDLIMKSFPAPKFITNEYREEPHIMVCSMSFGLALFEIINTFNLLWPTYIVSTTLLRNVPGLFRLIEEKKAYSITMSPSFWRLYTNPSPSLKLVMVAGESARGIYHANEYPAIYNMYGSSETGCFLFGMDLDKPYEQGPLGQPIVVEVDSHLEDKDGNRVEGLGEGEVCCRNPYLRGYINLPEKTQEAIRDGVFHTRDLARFDEEGTCILIGRIDEMVKINGQRVEPGEVEYVIRNVKGVKNAAVKGFEENGRTFLGAFYVAEDNVTDADILSAVSARLPAYMIPERIVKMDALPLNANGKLDRLALTPPPLKTKNVAPETKEEELALSVARKLLTNVEFGVTDDLDELGMDSIVAMHYSLMLHEAGMEISASDIFKYRNIRRIVSGDSRMMWFVQDYDESKPVLVIASGIVMLRPVLPFYEQMSRSYNILVIEPVQDHYENELEGLKYDELVEQYMDQIAEIVPDVQKIIGFMGFSFGGELSASLAHRFEELYGRKTFAILGDTIVKLQSEYTDREITGDDLSESVIMGMKEKLSSFLERLNIINSFGYGEKYACYDGPVTLIDAQIGYTDAEETAKLENAKGRYPDLTIIPMEKCTHSDLFRNLELLPFYEKLIEDNLQK